MADHYMVVTIIGLCIVYARDLLGTHQHNDSSSNNIFPMTLIHLDREWNVVQKQSAPIICHTLYLRIHSFEVDLQPSFEVDLQS